MEFSVKTTLGESESTQSLMYDVPGILMEVRERGWEGPRTRAEDVETKRIKPRRRRPGNPKDKGKLRSDLWTLWRNTYRMELEDGGWWQRSERVEESCRGRQPRGPCKVGSTIEGLKKLNMFNVVLKFVNVGIGMVIEVYYQKIFDQIWSIFT